jgi:membrane-bound serine protease (ClpP class)
MRRLSFVGVFRAAYLASLVVGALLVALSAFLDPSPTRAQTASSNRVDVADFKLAITPISAQYYDRVIQGAENDGAQAVIFQIDTPGGLVTSMQDMVQRTLASRVPVVVYVAPQGAMSASAGVFVVYASHVAAMAPNSTLGSSEVIINAGSSDSGATPESGDAAAERRKATNMLVSLIRNLADTRGRNADFGEKAVRQSENVGAQAALDQHIVDIVAPDLNDLLRQLDGRQVKLQSGTVTLHTKDAVVNQVGRSAFEEILFVITDPSVAFILISLGTLGITWEFINPGAVFPGVIGAILLLIGLLALGTLPINAAGLVFLALAFVMFIADVFMPTHGILTAGGIVSLVLGGMILINTGAAPGIPGVSPYTIAGVALALGGFFFFAVYKVFQARKMRPSTGLENLVGSVAETRTDLAPQGMVFVQGELWNARSVDGSLPSGQKVRVVGTEGLTLNVKREA